MFGLPSFFRTTGTTLLLLMAAGSSLSQVVSGRRAASVPKTVCPVLPTQITAPQTLDQSCYLLTSYTTISAKVSVEPGVTILASQGAAIYVERDGSLEAVGTADKPIVFRGKDRVSGVWFGLSISNVSARNHLSYVHVEDAGGKHGSNSSAIFVFGAAAIDHSIIANSATVGVRVDGNGRLLDFTANRLEKNDVPLSVPAELIGSIDADTEFVANKQQIVSVTKGEVTSPASWRALKVPIAFESFAHIEAAVSIQPGLIMTFANATSMYVEHGGSLHAVGTADSPIVFTGRGELPGAWGGIGFGTQDRKNVLEYVHVDYAGDAANQAAIVAGAGNQAYVEIRHVSIAHSQFSGILIRRPSRTLPSGAELDAANSFVDCGGEHVVVK